MTATRSSRWWTSTTTSAGLTAVCSVLVAVSAFLAASAASDADDLYASSNLDLTDANFLLGVAVEGLLAESDDEFDRVCVVGLINSEAESVCTGDDDLRARFADDPIWAGGFEAQDDADEAYARGLVQSARSVAFQAALVMFATGLALSAWASLADTGARQRAIFTAISAGSLALGLLRLVTV